MEKSKKTKTKKVIGRSQKVTFTKINLSYLLMTWIFKRMSFVMLMQRNPDLVFRQPSITDSRQLPARN